MVEDQKTNKDNSVFNIFHPIGLDLNAILSVVEPDNYFPIMQWYIMMEKTFPSKWIWNVARI